MLTQLDSSLIVLIVYENWDKPWTNWIPTHRSDTGYRLGVGSMFVHRLRRWPIATTVGQCWCLPRLILLFFGCLFQHMYYCLAQHMLLLSWLYFGVWTNWIPTHRSDTGYRLGVGSMFVHRLRRWPIATTVGQCWCLPRLILLFFGCLFQHMYYCLVQHMLLLSWLYFGVWTNWIPTHRSDTGYRLGVGSMFVHRLRRWPIATTVGQCWCLPRLILLFFGCLFQHMYYCLVQHMLLLSWLYFGVIYKAKWAEYDSIIIFIYCQYELFVHVKYNNNIQYIIQCNTSTLEDSVDT